jgi:HlyD family secretion protein
MLVAATALTIAFRSILHNPPASGNIDPGIRSATTPPGTGDIDRGQIGAVGVVEPSSQPINIGTNVSATITDVFVAPEAKVSRGDKLFALDARIAQATLDLRRRDLATAQARLAQARARVPGLQAEVEVARTTVEAAQSDYEEALDLVQIAAALRTGGSITAREATRRKNALRTALARLSEARARVALAQANLSLFDEVNGGASIALEIAAVEQERGSVSLAEMEVELRTVRAPEDGTVLQVNVRPGEFAQASALSLPLIIMGRMTPLYARVDIDEADIARLLPDAAATASLRGSAGSRLNLRFVRIEPLVVPKHSLSGQLTERTDTRVLQTIYEIVGGVDTLWPGQQLDVLIQDNRRSPTFRPESSGKVVQRRF